MKAPGYNGARTMSPWLRPASVVCLEDGVMVSLHAVILFHSGFERQGEIVPIQPCG